MPPQGPSSHEDLSLQSPAPAQVAASPVLGVRQELQPTALGPGMATPPGGAFAEPLPQVVPPAGRCSSLVSLQKYLSPVSSSEVGCPSGKCDPLQYVCHFRCCSLPALPSPRALFPSNLVHTWSHACPAAVHANCVWQRWLPWAGGASFSEDLAQSSKGGQLWVGGSADASLTDGKTSFMSSSAGQVFELHRCSLVAYPLPGAGMDRDRVQSSLLPLLGGHLGQAALLRGGMIEALKIPLPDMAGAPQAKPRLCPSLCSTGEAGEPWGAPLSPRGVQPSLPAEQVSQRGQGDHPIGVPGSIWALLAHPSTHLAHRQTPCHGASHPLRGLSG